MGLLKSVKDVPGIDFYDYRDSNYYGKYAYRVRFTIAGLRYALYEKTVESFLKRVNATAGWKVIKAYDKQEVNENLEAIQKFIELRNTIQKDKLGVVRGEHNSVSIFSNDLHFLKSVENIKPDAEYDYTQAQTTTFVGTKTFVKEPKHKYRIYLKSKIIEPEFIDQLDKLLKNTPNLVPCNSLKYWIKGAKDPNRIFNWKYRYSNPIHFIDYDNESTLSYLMLMCGEYFGKRYKLIKRPDII